MFGKILVLLSIVVSFACSQPRYVNPNVVAGTGGTDTSQGKPEGECLRKFPKTNLCLDWKWEKAATSSTAGAIEYFTYRKNLHTGEFMLVNPDQTISVLLWMPSMGHGSSPTATQQLDIGTFRASNVFFVMPGEWQIKFQLKEGSTVKDELVFAYTL